MSDVRHLMILDLLLSFCGYILGALSVGTLAAALSKLLWRKTSHNKTAALTAFLLLAQFCFDLIRALLIQTVNAQYHPFTPYFWAMGVGRIVPGTAFGTVFGYWIIAKLTRPLWNFGVNRQI